MPDAHANFATSLVATAPSPATSGTSLVVTAAEGSRFPAVPFNAVVAPVDASPTPANAEVVRVTARATDTLTITRTQEGSSARSVVVGDRVYAGVTAKTLTDIEAPSTADLLTLSPYVACEADAIAGADGDPIDTWANPGSLADVTATGTGRPTLRLGNRGIGGRAALSFDASANFMTLPDLSALTNGTIIAVLKADRSANPVGTGLWRIGTDASSGDHYPFTGSELYEGAGSTVRKGAPVYHARFNAAHVYTVRSASADFSAAFDGGVHYSTATNTVGFHATPWFGKNVNTNFWGGRVSALYIFPLLAAADQQLAENLLRLKYGTPA